MDIKTQPQNLGAPLTHKTKLQLPCFAFFFSSWWKCFRWLTGGELTASVVLLQKCSVVLILSCLFLAPDLTASQWDSNLCKLPASTSWREKRKSSLFHFSLSSSLQKKKNGYFHVLSINFYWSNHAWLLLLDFFCIICCATKSNVLYKLDLKTLNFDLKLKSLTKST